jgi:hypothetical protein
MRAVVSLGSLAWSFGVIALVLKSGFINAPRPLADPLPASDRRLALPVDVLNRAEGFYSAQVGFAGTTPDVVLAWRVIAQSPDHHAVFEQVFRTASLPGRLYALAGLWLGDRSEFDRAARELRARGGTVRTMRGCIMAEESVASLVTQIEKGDWSREFITGRLSSD